LLCPSSHAARLKLAFLGPELRRHSGIVAEHLSSTNGSALLRRMNVSMAWPRGKLGERESHQRLVDIHRIEVMRASF
jgi:hypothetical protein